MGKRKTTSTKGGRFMNPTDQQRKVDRRKELKRNKLQRVQVCFLVSAIGSLNSNTFEGPLSSAEVKGLRRSGSSDASHGRHGVRSEQASASTSACDSREAKQDERNISTRPGHVQKGG